MANRKKDQAELKVVLPDGRAIVIPGEVSADKQNISFQFDPANPDHVEVRKQMREDGLMNGRGRVEGGPDGWLSVVKCGDEPWPVAPDEFFGREPAKTEPAESGYAVVVCIYAEDDVTGDPDDIGPIQRREVVEWSTYDGELRAWFSESDFDFPETGWHMMGYVSPDGSVLMNDGYRFKSIEWWAEGVRALRRAIASGRDGDFSLPEEAFVHKVPVLHS
jgi:hypothetical protein